MLKDSNVETKIKINDKGKFCGTPEGDKQGDPLEKIGWGRSFDNRNLTKCNLKMYPSVFKKDFRLKIHPKYLCDKNVIHECVAANAYLSQRTESHFTDDTFFTGELIRAILSIFARTDLNYNQKCILLARKFHENLKDFAATNKDMLGECGENTCNILLGNKKGGPTNQSNRNGCAMRIPLVGIFANSLSELWKIVLASIRNTHYCEHSFDAARSVANIAFLARAGLSQESMAKFINLEFRSKYTQFVKENGVNKRTKDLGYKYKNEDHFLDFNMDNLTLQSVYNDRLKYKYTETALDTVVVALRIMCVAGSFYEACVLAKAYGGDSDTLLAILLAMEGVVSGVPKEIQKQTKNQLQKQNSPELKSYVQLSDDMDKQVSNRYPENISLEEQLKQTYSTIEELIKNEQRDIETINKSIGFNKEVDQIIYSNSLPSEFSWDQKPETFLFYFVLLPIILVGIAFYLLSSELALIVLIAICIVDFIAFRITTKAMVKAFFSEKENLVLSESNISPNVQELQSEISIIDSDVLNIDNKITKSEEFKQLIKSIIKDWNFYLDPDKRYDLNQRKEFEYEADGKQPEFKEGDYKHYLNTLKEYATSCEAELKGLKEKLIRSDQRLTELNQKLTKLNEQLNALKQKTKVKADETKSIIGTIKKTTGDIEGIKKEIEETKEKIEEINNDKEQASELPKIIKETKRQITDLKKLGSKQIYDNYINEEKALYEKINAHNKATAEFKTQKKLEKLKSLTPEKIEEINKYVNKINEIAEKCGIENKINFDQDEFSKWQQNPTEKIPNSYLEKEIITTSLE